MANTYPDWSSGRVVLRQDDTGNVGDYVSKIAKCPICKDKPVEHGRDSYGEIGISCCGVTVWSKDNPTQWNRYAAAMELAKAEVAASNAIWSVPLDRVEATVEAGEDMLFQARMRVLEVFA